MASKAAWKPAWKHVWMLLFLQFARSVRGQINPDQCPPRGDFSETFDENELIDIRCIQGVESINVTSASYKCYDTTGSIAHNNSLDIARDHCNGKSFCDGITASDDSFGDPCRGAYKYYLEYFCKECSTPLGMEDGRITDDQISSSSEYNSGNLSALNARLNAEWGWAAKSVKYDPARWIMVDLIHQMYISGVITQGLNKPDVDQWVIKFNISYSDDNFVWRDVLDDETNQSKVFSGNSDKNTEVQNSFDHVIRARFVRIHPVLCERHCAMRFEILGCNASIASVDHVCENNVLNVSCRANETIFVASAFYNQQTSNHSLQAVRQQCNGKQSCSVLVNNTLSEDPCRDRFQRYLELEYLCEAVCCPKCLNGGTCGERQSDVCQCPSGYIGDTCETGICLNETTTNTTVGTLTWPETVIGEEAESTERCPVDTQRRDYARATRICNSTHRPTWAEADINDCGQSDIPGIQDLAKTTVTEANAEEVADALASAVDKSNADSEGINIEDVQEALCNIVNVGSPSLEITGSVINIVDQILDAKISSSEENKNSANASSIILQSVEQQIAQTLEKHENFILVQSNIVVEAVTIHEAQIEDGLMPFEISFPDSSFQNGADQSPDPNSDDTESQYESYIQLPNDALFKNRSAGDTKVSVVGYSNNKLFQSRMLTAQNKSRIVGPIISAVVLGEDVNDLMHPVIVQISPSKVEDTSRSDVWNTSRCVFWDFNKHGGIGDWAEEGCERVNISSGRVTCHCNHLTNFAVLMDFSGQHGQPETTFTFVLDIISKIGCAFSVVSLCFTLLVFLLCRGIRMTLQRKILVQFCFSMLCLYFVFLVAIDSKSDVGCTVASALLHYFVLSTMLWMAVEARHMYISFVSESGRGSRKFLGKAACFAWGLPLIPVVVVLVVYLTIGSSYSADIYCFLAPGYGLYFGVLVPIAMVILHNTITFVLVLRQLMTSTVGGKVDDKPDRTEITQRLQNAFAISVLIGLTWVFGFLAIDEAKKAFQLLFCIFNSFQGVVVFILFCYAQKDIRKVLAEKCCGAPTPVPPKKMKPINIANNENGRAAPGFSTVSSSTFSSGDTSSSTYNNTVITTIDEEDAVCNTKVTSLQSDKTHDGTTPLMQSKQMSTEETAPKKQMANEVHDDSGPAKTVENSNDTKEVSCIGSEEEPETFDTYL